MTSAWAARVLILDDDPAIGGMMRTQLTRGGHEAQYTAAASEFYDLQRNWQPTHVIVDLVMSGVDGLEVLSELAHDECTAEVIISSGVGGRVLDAARRFADEEGLVIAGLLPKPYSRVDLLNLIREPDGHANQVNAHRGKAGLPDWSDAAFATDFSAAILLGHIRVAYQPKVRCTDGKLTGFEALARWTDPDRGEIPPSDFVPRAEAAGLVAHLTDAVVGEALAWFASNAEFGGLRMSLNISAAELNEPGLDQRLVSACDTAGVSTDRVTLELTETSAMDDAVLSLQLLTRLRLVGFHMSLDDFGTGYSSMVQLARLPFSEIKVDRSFVMTALDSPESVIVIRSIIDLGHSLGLECTAEGVEDAAVLSMLNDFGCDFAQGYYIGRPMYADQLASWLDAQDRM